MSINPDTVLEPAAATMASSAASDDMIAAGTAQDVAGAAPTGPAGGSRCGGSHSFFYPPKTQRLLTDGLQKELKVRHESK